MSRTKTSIWEILRHHVGLSQAREAVASTGLDSITALFAHNQAKRSLARARGGTEPRLGTFICGPGWWWASGGNVARPRCAAFGHLEVVAVAKAEAPCRHYFTDVPDRI